MKTLILVTICILMFGAASFAQVDTSRNRMGIRPTPVQPVQPAQPVQPTVQPAQPVQPVQPALPQSQPQAAPMPQQPTTNPQDGPTGWSPVNNQAIPDNLRQTLNSPQYQGGSLYTNPDNSMYQFRTNNATNPQVIYFDKDGKVTTAPPHD